MYYPACWDQTAKLSNDDRFKGNVTAYSIVVDSSSTWQQIQSKVPALASAQMLFDTQKKASGLYGVMTLPSSMHPGLYPGHTYVVIDKQGIVRYVYDDPKMALNNDLIAREIAKL